MDDLAGGIGRERIIIIMVVPNMYNVAVIVNELDYIVVSISVTTTYIG